MTKREIRSEKKFPLHGFAFGFALMPIFVVIFPYLSEIIILVFILFCCFSVLRSGRTSVTYVEGATHSQVKPAAIRSGQFSLTMTSSN